MGHSLAASCRFIFSGVRGTRKYHSTLLLLNQHLTQLWLHSWSLATPPPLRFMLKPSCPCKPSISSLDTDGQAAAQDVLPLCREGEGENPWNMPLTTPARRPLPISPSEAAALSSLPRGPRRRPQPPSARLLGSLPQPRRHFERGAERPGGGRVPRGRDDPLSPTPPAGEEATVFLPNPMRLWWSTPPTSSGAAPSVTPASPALLMGQSPPAPALRMRMRTTAAADRATPQPPRARPGGRGERWDFALGE